MHFLKATKPFTRQDIEMLSLCTGEMKCFDEEVTGKNEMINEYLFNLRKTSMYENERRSEMRQCERIKLFAELEAEIYRPTNEQVGGSIS